MRCIVCGRLVKDELHVYKTCCVNKLYVFCSEDCRKKWAGSWLRMQITTQRTSKTAKQVNY